jgi:hypothetical protein
MLSSGTTAQATTSDTAVTVIAASDAKINRVTFINEGTVAGFGSIDGVSHGCASPLPPQPPRPSRSPIDFRESPKKNPGIQIKRIASGSNMSGVYVYAS